MNDPLDNAVHAALTTHQATIAEIVGTARRYPADVNVFAAVDRFDAAAWSDLGELVGPSGVAVLFRDEIPEPPEGWTTLTGAPGNQYVLDSLHADAPTGDGVDIRTLTDADGPAMVALTSATEPGPFKPRTHELGHYVGVFDDGQLVAMAGQRFHIPGAREISAVCTAPAARGRGLAAVLTAHVARLIQADGEQAFLHTRGDNHGAQRVYERLGFVLRRHVDLKVVRAPA